MAKKKHKACDPAKARAIIAMSRSGIPIDAARKILKQGGCGLAREIDKQVQHGKFNIEHGTHHSLRTNRKK